MTVVLRMTGDGVTIPAVPKGPGENLDYQIDWSDWLGTDTITGSPTWTIPAGLVAGTVSNTTTTANQFLSGGEIGQDYPIDHTIVTAAGRTASRRFIVQVRIR